jgi:hypothetical protein
MSGTIALTGPSTTPGATALDAPTVNAAVNAALATKAPLASPTFTGTPSIGTGGTALVGASLQATGTSTTTQQIEVQNLSAATTASSDLIATANDGTDATLYVDVGINSSGNTDPTFTIAAAHDAYAYSVGGNLAIGTASAAQTIRFFTGGTLLANQRGLITDTGINATAIGATTAAAAKFTTVSATGQITSTLASGTAPFVVASTTVVANLNASTLGGATFANPGAIGATPSTGNFTTLGATGLISPTSTVGIKGTATNDSAPAGSIGEFITATVAAGSAVALTTATPANVTSVSLTAGDWDVWGTVAYTPAATTSITTMQGGINTTTAALPAATTGAYFANFMAAFVPGAINPSYSTGTLRLSLASTTTVYLVAQAAFTVAAMGAFGFIGARRVR